MDDPASGASDDDEMFQLLLAVSGFVDSYCNRHFFSLTATRYFDGGGKGELLVPDLVSVTSLKEDTNEDGTYEKTWAATDYHLAPYSADPASHWGQAYAKLLVRNKGAQASFAAGQRNFEIAGTWGFRDFVEASASLVDEASGVSATQATFNVDSGSDFAIGHTVRIDSEDLLVIGVSGATLTVSRGINGTTAATHADDATVSILRWPAAVERATLINAARVWTRAPAFEPFYVDVDVDTDVRLLLEPYRKVTT